MRVFARVAVTISLLTLAAVRAAAAADSSPAASDVVGHLYVDDNTAGQHRRNEHDCRLRPARRRHADASARFAVCSGGAGTGTGIGRRVRCRSPVTASTCSPSTPAAIKSQCCASTPTASCARSGAARSHGRCRARQHRRPWKDGLRRQRRQELHRLMLNPAGHLRPLAGIGLTGGSCVGGWLTTACNTTASRR